MGVPVLAGLRGYSLGSPLTGERNMSVAPLLTDAVTAPSQTHLSKDKLASSVLTALLGLVLVYAASSTVAVDVLHQVQTYVQAGGF
jgi:hypothetical protein